MELNVKFEENDVNINTDFKAEVYQISDGGFEKGYNEGYDKGNKDGQQIGYDKGIVDGKQAEYDKFWDSFQQNGNLTKYAFAFTGKGWTQETLKPKYLIKPESGADGCESMFVRCNWRSPNELIDFSLIKDKFDFSQCTLASKTFQNCFIDNIDVDFSNCTMLTETFNHSNNGKTPNVRLKVSEKTGFNGVFYNGQYTKVTFTEDSVIAQNGLNLGKLIYMEKSHLTSVINALSTTTSGLTVALSLQAVNKAFETTENAKDGSNSAEWKTLVATKTNWTINLA
jgi:hypothetical protein